ncbi:hypothetical protein SRABI106_02406 [Rahnella aquatilis]|nr:hypothetical protein SRABI106_02406 [Rahnella aquatilis]
MTGISVLPLDADKANFHAIFQIAATGRFADPNLFNHLFHRPADVGFRRENPLNQFERIRLDAFGRRGCRCIAGGQIEQLIQGPLIDHFHITQRLHQLHKALE